MSVLEGLIEALAGGTVSVVDLTHRLDPDFPVIVLPPEFGQCARFRMEEVSAYDHRGPAWKWHDLTLNEHTGTHFDARRSKSFFNFRSILIGITSLTHF